MKLVLRFDGPPAALGDLRASHDWEVLAQDGCFWARAADTPTNRTRAAELPADARFVAHEDGLLIPNGATLPVGEMPAGEWQSAKELVEICRAAAQLAGVANSAIPIELHPSDKAEVATSLLLDWGVFEGWAREAPDTRLSRLRIAVSAGGKTMVRGTPLPPTPGHGFYWRSAIAIPCGYDLAPHLWPELVQQSLSLRPGDTAMIHIDGQIDVITEDHWCEASRSSVELTARAERGKEPR